MTRNQPSTASQMTSPTPQDDDKDRDIMIHTSKLFDPKQKKFLSNITLQVSPKTGLITSLTTRTHSLSSTIPSSLSDKVIDLRHKTVLPGLVDAHTHIFLHPYIEASSVVQMRDESQVERILRASNHCRAALLAGYTTYRDLGTEGLGDADVHVRDAVNRGIIPGPRIFCATEALASSGGYEVRIESRSSLPGGSGAGTDTVRISDPCDGVTGVKAAVRRRIGAGADVIKFYADYRKRALRFPPALAPGCPDVHFAPEGTERSPNYLLFEQEEMDAIVAEAKRSRAPVAAHAQSAEGVIMAAKAGVTSVEHGLERSSESLRQMKESGTIFVPTLAVMALYYPDMSPIFAQVKEAYEIGVKLACGGDTGAFAHGDNAWEIELMLQAGVPLEEVLTAATLHGWEACGGEWSGRKFGWWEAGCAADIVALGGDVEKDVECLRKVDFVMKDAKVWKRDGRAVGMM